MPDNRSKPVLSISNLSVSFPSRGRASLEVIEGISCQIHPREFVSILGPSGCGKTTLIRAVAGLIEPSQGSIIYLDGKPAGQKRVGLVFQDANLMPWRTVTGNISLPLEIYGTPAAEIKSLVAEMIALVQLEGFEKSYPQDLSGGMAQRVAIARALVQDPDLLLLDEPFGSLDALTRERMGSELLSIWQARQKTVLMVTHSISEAVFLSDRVIVLTPRPARINLDLPIDLPRPRDERILYLKEFGKLARNVRRAIVEVPV